MQHYKYLSLKNLCYSIDTECSICTTVVMALDFSKVPQNIPGKPVLSPIHVPDQEISDFKALLELSRIGPKTWYNEQTEGKFGVSRDWLINAKDAWMNNFDWRQQEAHVNSFPNFNITISNPDYGQLGLHFLALFSAKTDAIPIIFMHGWPGSFVEFLPMLQIMRKKYTPESLPYHVIVPSLPGYGFSSDIGHDKEFNLNAAAQVMNQLMINLGFSEGYVAQGGDVGSMLSLILLKEFKECKAAHGMLTPSPRDNTARTLAIMLMIHSQPPYLEGVQRENRPFEASGA